MSAALRLDLIQRTYKEGDRWTWRLWAGARIVSSSGNQLYSRRADCVRGAEVGAGVEYVAEALNSIKAGFVGYGYRFTPNGSDAVTVRILDERSH